MSTLGELRRGWHRSVVPEMKKRSIPLSTILERGFPEEVSDVGGVRCISIVFSGDELFCADVFMRRADDFDDFFTWLLQEDVFVLARVA